MASFQTPNSLILLSKLQNIKKLQVISSVLSTTIFILNIRCTLNNIYIVLSDYFGNLILGQSGGALKIPLVTKKSSYRFELTFLHVLKRAIKLKMQYFILRLDINLITKKRLIFKLLNQFKFTVIGLQLEY